MGTHGGSRAGSSGGGSSPLMSGQPKTVRTYYSRGAYGAGGYYNDEALDANFDKASGTLTLDYAEDKEWSNGNRTSNKRQYLNITVENGIINGKPVNVDFSNNRIKSVDAPSKLTSGTEKLLRDNDFEYSSKTKRWEKGYKGYYTDGNTLHVDKALPDDLSKYTRIKGNTFDIKESIKKAGFKWNGAEKSWDKK